MPGLMTTRSPVPARTPAPSAPRMRGFGTDGSPLRIQTSRWFSDGGAELDENLPVRAPDRRRPRSGAPRGRRPRGCESPSRGHNPRMTRAASLHGSATSWARRRRRGAAPSRTTRPNGTSVSAVRGGSSPTCASRWRGRRSRAIRSAAARRPHASSRPRSATTRRSATPSRARGGCRATRGTTRYAELREKLDELGRRLGGEYRVLVDANQHVDREAAARSGVGFYGKNTMLITRRHGSWVVLGTLVTDGESSRRRRSTLDCGSCTLCIDACPTDALDEPGRSTRRAASPTGRRRRRRSRRTTGRARRAGLRLRHLPGRVPVEPRRREAARRREPAGERARSTSSRGSKRTGATLVDAVRPPVRAAKRPALAAAERARRARERRRRAEHAPRSSASRPATTSWSPSTRAGRSRASLVVRDGASRRPSGRSRAARCGSPRRAGLARPRRSTRSSSRMNVWPSSAAAGAAVSGLRLVDEPVEEQRVFASL